ncbi:hypothetical protein Rcae01_04771 [Novipirellula caenicola]|uniref:Uncharacterized protein n=1 Tax=Novipirellula caenicola TaxID=1536901 RepID=A0ABP9VZG5_9BACT
MAADVSAASRMLRWPKMTQQTRQSSAVAAILPIGLIRLGANSICDLARSCFEKNHVRTFCPFPPSYRCPPDVTSRPSERPTERGRPVVLPRRFASPAMSVVIRHHVQDTRHRRRIRVFRAKNLRRTPGNRDLRVQCKSVPFVAFLPLNVQISTQTHDS